VEDKGYTENCHCVSDYESEINMSQAGLEKISLM
jgi:hypothetical protein